MDVPNVEYKQYMKYERAYSTQNTRRKSLCSFPVSLGLRLLEILRKQTLTHQKLVNKSVFRVQKILINKKKERVMGFDMTAYNFAKEGENDNYLEEICNFHVFYLDPNIGVLVELMEILPSIKLAETEWDVSEFDGICSLESVKKAKEKFTMEMCESFEINISTDTHGNRTSEMCELDYPFEKINMFLDEILKNAGTQYIGLQWS